METLKKQAAKLLGEQKKYRRWLAVFLCLAVVVTAGTTAALKMNGQALSHEKKVLACGEEVHVHTAECYESGIIPVLAEGENPLDKEQPICGYADYVVHVHGEECFGEDGTVVCPIPERKPHVHTAECFQKQMVLACGQEETEIHQHTEACRELICGQEETQAQGHQHTEECKALICGQEESEGHQHTEACHTVTQGELICGNTEEGHEHTAECYEQIDSITCGMEESEGHTHTDACYDMQACGQEEGIEGHTHTEECYGPYICGYGEETEGHIHTDACYQVKEVPVCGELELHTHTEECYDAEGTLICGIPELKEHVHGEECFEIIQVEDEEDSTKLFQKVYEDAEIRVTAEYTAEANIPEEAELVAERVDAAADSMEESEETGAEAEAAEEKVSYRLRFLVDGAEIEPEGTVSFIVQGLDGEGNDDSGELATLMYKAGDGLDTMVVTLILTGESTKTTGEQLFQKIYEDAEIRVTAEYAEDANIPENAQLVAEKLETDTQATDENAEAVKEGNVQEPAETTSDVDTASIETVKEEVSYRLKFLADGTEVEPEGTVTFTAQLLDEKGREKGEVVTLTYSAGDGLDTMTITLAREVTVEVQHGFRQVAEDGNVRVIAEYDSDANIPEEAELRVEQITADKNAEYYAELETAYLEQGGENATMDALLNIGLYVGDRKVEPQTFVDITIQMPHNIPEKGFELSLACFDNTDVEKQEESDVAIDEEGYLTARIKENNLGVYAIGTVQSSDYVRQECVDEEETVKVIAEYGSEAGLPKDAKLEVRRIKEDNADYQEREAEFKNELGDEDAEIGLLLNIGFYVDGVEVEPTGAVAITIQILDDSIEVDEKTDIVHFSEEKETFKDVDVEKDTDGNTTMSFEAKSFSTYAVRATVTRYSKIGISSTSELDGKTFLIAYVNGSYGGALKNYSYTHNSLGEGLDDVRFGGKDPVTVSDFNSDDMKDNNGDTAVWEWSFEKSNSGYYIQCGNTGKYLNIEKQELSLGSRQRLSVEVVNGKIKISRRYDGKNYYVTFGGGNYFGSGTDSNASGSQLTLYTKEEVTLPEKYTIRYWKNENSITSFQNEASSGGTLIGSIDAVVDTDGGRSIVRIPVTGNVTNAEGTSTSIGRLDDLDGGYVFYGWSPKSNANYRWDKAYMIYCGEAFQFPGNVTVPTYTPEGFEVDVSARVNEYIDIYATWAAPNGISYYGGNRQSLAGEHSDKVVEFYIRLDGKMPNEPGSFSTNEYTEGLKAKNPDNSVVDNPLKYWMHIYGAGNEEAVRANLNYEPSDEDILKALANKGNVMVDGKSVDFKSMSLNDYQKNYYVVWYVCKDQNEWWHIDGTLMQKTKWTLKYDGNGVTDPNTIIPGTQYAYKENNGKAVVHNTIQKDVESDTEPVRMGYKFLGWSTVKSDTQHTGTWFAAQDEITVDSNGQVYKKGKTDGSLTVVEGLTATKDSKGVWEVILYAQWEKVTHIYTIEKKWEDENSIINPLIQAITFDIYRYATKDGKPIKVDENEEPIAELFAEGRKLESSKNWKMEIVLDETDDEGNPYTYIMRETGISGSGGGEISGALGGYVMDYTKVNMLYTLTNALNPQKTVAITVKKTDKEDNSLQGAVFKLSKKEGETWVSIAENYTSDENGIVIDHGVLVEGSYALEEVSAPDGYLLNKASIEFDVKEIEISADNKEMKLEVKNLNNAFEEGWAFDEQTNTLTVQDVAAAMAINLKKISDQNMPGGGLEGAEFIVTNVDNEYLKSTDGSKVEWVGNQKDATRFVTGTDGMKQLPALPIGTYTLTEVKAPDGYNLRESTIVFEIRNNAAKTEVELEWHPETVYGTEYQTNEYWQGESIQNEIKTTIIVTNSKGIVLPETGGSGTTMYTLGGFAVIAASLMYGLSMRRKKRKGGSH